LCVSLARAIVGSLENHQSPITMQREIPPLHVLCLRAVGSHACSAEDSFCKTTDKHLSTASRLLRSFHQRPTLSKEASIPPALAPESSSSDGDNTNTSNSLVQIPLKRTPCIGQGSARRNQANEVDLNHPIIACSTTPGEIGGGELIMEFGNPALDCLQAYIDSLVELGRMDDSRLGQHFFTEWKANVLLAEGKELDATSSRKSRRRSLTQATPSDEPVPLGSLSLFNCTIFDETIDAMVDSNMGENLAVLDMTGIQGLSDEMLVKLLPNCPNLQRLSIKNCRRLTKVSVDIIGTHLKKLRFLDIGGSFNVKPQDLLDVIPGLPDIVELHASGLAWSNPLVQELCYMRPWTGLSLGFTQFVTAAGLKEGLLQVADTLTSLALPFCESMVDNALLGVLGRNLPNIVSLDLRGNGALNSLSAWYDGKASASLKGSALLVLARYSSITKQSVEDTKRIHPVEAAQLTCVLDGDGVGIGIRR
jgi:hypothetical protein